MLDLHKLSVWARARAKIRIDDAPKSEISNPRSYTALNQPFHKRLLDACRLVPDNPKGIPDSLFIGLPERLLGKCAYLCLGKGKKSTGESLELRPEGITDDTINFLRALDEEGQKAFFMNLETTEQMPYLKHVLLCHGLSPIEDSILLLADLGRGFRTSWILGTETQVMLADISWMSANRSIRQFPTLNDKRIDTGLRVCLDKRTRLYESVAMQPKLHEIVHYDKSGKISGRKLEQISSRYLRLAQALWGEKTFGRLDHDQVKTISRQLDWLPGGSTPEIPKHMSTLGQFAGVLPSMEEKLKPHLEILRVIAKQFNSFDEEVFTYFFAQYYAQDAYRGAVLKVAPESERTFDEPFDKLDPYFRAWGDGHSTTDITAGSVQAKPMKPLSVAYLPQYSIGGLTVLPYTPLSLDALRLEEKNHNLIRRELIMLEYLQDLDAAREKNSLLLKRTPLVRRNRLLADVMSFLMLCLRRHYESEITEDCCKLGYATIGDLLVNFSPSVPTFLAREREAHKAEDLASLWQTWLENIPSDDNPDYIPTHLYFYLLEEFDWSDQRLKAAASICILAQMMYTRLT